MTVLNWNDTKHMALRVFTKYFDVTESSVYITEDTNLTLACLQMRTLLLTGRPNNRQTDQILLDLPLQIAGSSCELLIHFNVTFVTAIDIAVTNDLGSTRLNFAPLPVADRRKRRTTAESEHSLHRVLLDRSTATAGLVIQKLACSCNFRIGRYASLLRHNCSVAYDTNSLTKAF